MLPTRSNIANYASGEHSRIICLNFTQCNKSHLYDFSNILPQVNKVTSKISKCVGVMRRLNCQLPANVMVKQTNNNDLLEKDGATKK